MLLACFCLSIDLSCICVYDKSKAAILIVEVAFSRTQEDVLAKIDRNRRTEYTKKIIAAAVVRFQPAQV
jgi:hypothetical protein